MLLFIGYYYFLMIKQPIKLLNFPLNKTFVVTCRCWKEEIPDTLPFAMALHPLKNYSIELKRSWRARMRPYPRNIFSGAADN